MPKAKTEDDFVYFSMRFPKEVYEPLKIEAERNDRSLAGEMLHRLRHSLTTAKPTKRGAMQAAE
ncbi:Arc family DNA-binding protein [Bradyrhizobium sp. McL0615]|uniref:Arc family DNA-binding protein n=1 Tax=Bradyrhizobium sp. McL0615 TaxID=3415673 RepID=UPI003CF46509